MIEKQETFDIWKRNVGSRILRWKSGLSPEDRNLFQDYSAASLGHLERYILANYSLASLRDKQSNPVLDACVSYFGETIINLLPGSTWTIDLEDQSNVDFGLPCVETQYSGTVCVHMVLEEVLRKNTGTVLTGRLEKITDYDAYIRDLKKDDPS